MIIEGIEYSPKSLADLGVHGTNEKLDLVIAQIGFEGTDSMSQLRELKNLLGVFVTVATDLLDMTETHYEAASEVSGSEQLQEILHDLKVASDNVTQHSGWSKIMKADKSPDYVRCQFISDTMREIFGEYFNITDKAFDIFPLGERSEPNKPSAVAQPIS